MNFFSKLLPLPLLFLALPAFAHPEVGSETVPEYGMMGWGHMYGWGSGYWSAMHWSMWITWVLVWIALILGIVFLWQRVNKKK